MNVNASNTSINRIALIGQEGSGKSSLLYKYLNQDVDISKQDKIRANIADQKIISKDLKDLNNRNLAVWCYDTVGKESQKSLTKLLYRNALAIIIVFDLSFFIKNEDECLKQVKKWYKFSQSPDNQHDIIPLTYFVGAKLDLLSEDFENRRNKLFEKMNYIEKQYYVETSAYSNINIEKLFEDILKGVFLEFIAKTTTYELFQQLNVFTLKKANNEIEQQSSMSSHNQTKNYTSLFSQSQNTQNNSQNENKNINIPNPENLQQPKDEQNQIQNQDQIDLENQNQQYIKKSEEKINVNIQKNKTQEISGCC
ncbi:hypothetical protein ABPG74_016779 [Tetrahymena malaccensis]